ncbi:hypothetical protein LTS18_009365 [Coniosporium uncinatum]|uniref:Uncharacterized protein n=1 Tax=Coniosporium uncinatum TaxID=93489 RepID=A0ACC3DMN3_9PEZI|nr:hypothetical protein LTS18_009365 [Coniosporium uncinatum]
MSPSPVTNEKQRPLVLITGANGTIGFANLLLLLTHNYRVRCALRRPSAITQITSSPLITPYLPNLTFILVPSIAAPNAYDAAAQDVTFIIHTAGAIPLPSANPITDVLEPYVEGTANMLSAALKSLSVKRLVVTGAMAGLVDPATLWAEGNNAPKPRLSETSRPPDLPDDVVIDHPPKAYMVGKNRAMTMLSGFAEQHPEAHFDVVQVVPGTVTGGMDLVETREEARRKMDRVSSGALFGETYGNRFFGVVGVADCARCHVGALDVGRVRGGEMLVAAWTSVGRDVGWFWRDAVERIEGQFAEEVDDGVYTLGRKPFTMLVQVDSRRTEEMLGIEFQSFGDQIVRAAEWYRDLKG